MIVADFPHPLIFAAVGTALCWALILWVVALGERDQQRIRRHYFDGSSEAHDG